MDSDSSVPPLLSVACRFFPHDQWFTTHVDPDWKVRQVKSWLLAKCLPYAAPPSPPLRQSNRKPQRPPSPITFAPDPRHRPISPITFATPKQQPAEDDISSFEEPPPESPANEPEEEELLLPPPKKRAILPNASTAAKGDLYSQYTLIRFSTGQLLEDDLPLNFYDMQADELLELHRYGVVVPLPRSDLKRYLDAYWEGWVKILRIKPNEDEEDNYALYKIRPLETRVLEWKDRWLVVREGTIHIWSNQPQPRLIHSLSLADLVALTSSSHLPPSAVPTSNSRILLARFSVQPTSGIPTRTSSPLSTIDSDSSSSLSSPVFAHDSDDSSRPRRARQIKRKRKRREPEYLSLDPKDDSHYVSLLRVLHRHSIPASTFVESLPGGMSDIEQPRSAHPDGEDDDADDDAPLPLRHPPSLALLRGTRGGSSLGAVAFPEWRTDVLKRAQRAGLGRIGKAIEWLMNNGGEDPGFWVQEGSTLKKSKGKNRERLRKVRQPTSTDGYDSDVSDDASFSDGIYGEDDSDAEDTRHPGTRSETEWEGWMGDLRRQARVAKEERERAKALELARRIAEDAREAELGIPQLPMSDAEVTVSRVGTGADDRVRRAAMEPSAIVTSLSGINPPSHNPNSHLLPNHMPSMYGSTQSTYGGGMQPMLSSPSSNDSISFAFSSLAVAADVDNDMPPRHGLTSYAAHSRAQSQTHPLLHSVSLHDAHGHALSSAHTASGTVPPEAFMRRPSMPIIGSAGNSHWDAGSPPSSSERARTTAQGQSSTGMTEVRPGLARTGSASGSKLLRKKDRERDRESESDWRRRRGHGRSCRYQLRHAPGKRRRRGLARGVSMRAERLVKSLDSALDFVEGR
ncbi:hypothetical protein GGX14DRAFT_543007 [Mycena pura]|uniref:Uncharacterized protein n=1 Tax=Mycena pura TaxID=153505 RepID=A0AAD6VLS6_9AGAR|nr:hypothetical protein GGX14DRAFT_543007 [Mycena pura]